MGRVRGVGGVKGLGGKVCIVLVWRGGGGDEGFGWGDFGSGVGGFVYILLTSRELYVAMITELRTPVRSYYDI